MSRLSQRELLAFLNLMLEAERAGSKALLLVARETKESRVERMAQDIQKDEAHWCAVLTRAIARLEGTASRETGQFYQKVAALTDDKERLALVNRGQDWVVRKLREAIPNIADQEIAGDLSVMLTAHEDNIAKVAGSGLIG